ncbi:hypothetical protein GCM10023333_40440 [Ferrimonas pelagia]|uniref:Uncharacterized protein n=1 Tax=Ferrimonas pelagia TaxID=1177826 RepID=A0ABP9FGH1_9GAMM
MGSPLWVRAANAAKTVGAVKLNGSFIGYFYPFFIKDCGCSERQERLRSAYLVSAISVVI